MQYTFRTQEHKPHVTLVSYMHSVKIVNSVNMQGFTNDSAFVTWGEPKKYDILNCINNLQYKHMKERC
jgi:hypothetical protein